MLHQQYTLVLNAREALQDYCNTLAPTHFVQEIPDFGRGSIRNLLVHIVNTYQFWIGQFALKQTIDFKKAGEVPNLEVLRAYYKEVDGLMESFLQQFDNQIDTPIAGNNFTGTTTLHLTPLQLFTHVITHEFHHKGQVLSMSRHLGYIPPDTDIIR